MSRGMFPLLLALAVAVGASEVWRLQLQAEEGGQVSVKRIKSPGFDSDLPTVFTDICWDPAKKCFVLINDRSMAEFFMDGDAVQAKSFISGTGKYSLCGWTFVGGKSCVIDRPSMTIQLSVSRRKTENFPLATGGNPSALAWDGTNLWSADAGANRITRHAGAEDQFKVVASFPAAGKSVCGLAWDGKNLWSCDADTLFAYDGEMQVKARYLLPVRVSGITWCGTELWASAERKDEIYKIELHTRR